MNVKIKHASGTRPDWNSIDWEAAGKKVRLLQARIVKAKKAGKHRKVKSLQWILERSFHARLLAVKRVTGNKGKNTPGVDGVIWASMRGNSHVRFLGDLGGVIRPGYPT